MQEKNYGKTFIYNNRECYGQAMNYQGGELAIQVFDKETTEPMVTATVQLGHKLEKNQAFIKDYAENTGILDALRGAGIVSKIVGYATSGFTRIPLCEINTELLYNREEA